MIFIESPIFTHRLLSLLSDDEYGAFQAFLINNPEAGKVIKGTGGLRKVRVSASGHGKRGGARVIYYHFVSLSQIALVFIYAKDEQADLTADQKKALKQVIDNWR